MPHFFSDRQYSSVIALEHTRLIGTGQCVELVRHYSPTLRDKATPDWRPGQRVGDVANLAPGTVIATFYNGRYPSWPHGNHAAFFMRVSKRDEAGRITEIMVMDQFRSVSRGSVGSRPIAVKGHPERLGDGRPMMSNDLSYYYVVE